MSLVPGTECPGGFAANPVKGPVLACLDQHVIERRASLFAPVRQADGVEDADRIRGLIQDLGQGRQSVARNHTSGRIRDDIQGHIELLTLLAILRKNLGVEPAAIPLLADIERIEVPRE